MMRLGRGGAARGSAVGLVLLAAGGCAVEPSSSARATATSPLAAGIYRFESVATDACVAVAGASVANGADVVLAACTGAEAELWQVTARPDGSHRIVNAHSGKCLRAYADSNVQQGRCVYQRTKWLLEEVAPGEIRLESVKTGLCATDEGTLSQGACSPSPTPAQSFRAVASALPTCDDDAKNGDETDVDCGGGTCPACTMGESCLVHTDCTSGWCGPGICQSFGGCNDSIYTGPPAETDVDCGGMCPPCPVGDSCLVGNDCISKVCEDGTCLLATCDDGVWNGTETDTDCGESCDPCDVGLGCNYGTDCASSVCAGGVCAACTCSDDVQNCDETGTDCGGSCGPC